MSDPAAPIDEELAWTLLRAAAPGPEPVDATRVRAEGDPDAWLEIGRTGTWRASQDVTEEAAVLLDLFAPLRAEDELVIGQLGQSLDGRIATEGGRSRYVTGPEDRTRLHRLRALVDAVVVGAGTVAADDPLLTVRHVPGDHPVRVVLDPRGRLDPERAVFTDPSAETLAVRAGDAGAPPRRDGSEIHVPVNPAGELDLPALLGVLREAGLRRLLVEGGGVTVSRFLAAGLLDRLHVTVAPLLLGSGRRSVSLPPIEELDDAIRPACRTFSLGRDVLFDLDPRARSE